MTSQHQLKSNFAVDSKYEAFYTGGKVQFSKAGDYLFCQCGTQIQILKVETGKVEHTIGQDEDEVTSFALSPDDEILVVASRNLQLKQWNWKESESVRSWRAIHTGPVSCMSFDCSSTLLATGGSDSTIKVWDVIKQYCTHNLKGHHGVVSVAEFHPDLNRLQLITAADDYKIRVWDLNTSSCLAELQSHYSVITSIQFDITGDVLYSGGRDNVITIWDLKKFEKKKTIPVFESVESVILLENKELPELNVTSDDPHFITAGNKGELKVWNADTAQNVYTHKDSVTKVQEDGSTETTHAIVGAITVPGLHCMAVVTYDHNIILYKEDDLSLEKQFVGYNDEVLEIKFCGQEDSHIVVATNSELIKVFEVSTWNCQILKGHTDTVLAVEVFTKTSTFVSGSKDNTLRIWQMDEDKKFNCIAVGQGHTSAVASLGLSRLGASFIVSGGQDCTLKVWPVPKGLDSEKQSAVYAKITEKAHDKDINSIVVSPNDKLIATGSQDKTAKLWNPDTLAMVGVFRGHKRSIWCVQFSPVDQCLATSSADGTIKIWALSDYSCVKTFEGHDCSVLKVQFLTRGMQLLSCGSDGLIKLWTIKNNECVKTFDEHDEKVWALATSSSEDVFVSGGGDSKILLWKDVTTTEQEEARAKQIDIILKEQELSNLLHQKKYLKAIGLAITLEQPFRLLKILKEVIGDGKNDQLEKTLGKLRDDQIDSILRFAVQWNTNSRHSHVAQQVLGIVLRQYTPEELMKMPNLKTSLEGLSAYTERHFQRMNRLLQQTTFVDYTWTCMRTVADSGLSESSAQSNDLTGSREIKKIDSKSSSSSSEDEEENTSNKSLQQTLLNHKKVEKKLKRKEMTKRAKSSSSSDSSDDEEDAGDQMRKISQMKKLGSVALSDSILAVKGSESEDGSDDSEGQQTVFSDKENRTKLEISTPEMNKSVTKKSKKDAEKKLTPNKQGKLQTDRVKKLKTPQSDRKRSKKTPQSKAKRRKSTVN